MIHWILDWAGYWAVRAGAFAVQRLPLESALRLGQGLGTLIYGFNERRRVAYVNLKAAFPQSMTHERKRWTKEMYQQLGMAAIEMMRSRNLTEQDVDRSVTNHGYETYLECRRSGKGLILLTAHLGNWELSQVVEGLRHRPMMVLARKQKYKRLDSLLNSFRQYHGSVAVGKGAGTRDLIRTLRSGGCVGVLGDQSGGDEGVWVRFFGRLTTSPRGPIALALKLGVTVLPVFFVRRGGKSPCHDLCFEPPLQLERTGDREKDIQGNTQKYIHILESFITRYPSQWLWGHKRWKRTRTKRIAILSDGKPGHVKQSEALVKEIIEKGSQARPPYETRVEKIEVEFRSPWRRRLFPSFAFFFIPWAQGHLDRFRFFFSQECSEKLERTSPDLVVSAGAALVPLNLCLARENLAKSAVLMKPSFPFNLFRYPLALIPAHDQGLMPVGHFRIQGALSGIDAKTLEISRKKLSGSLPNPEKVRFSLFLGGGTRKFKLPVSEVEILLGELERAAEKLEADYLVTTSRRTPEAVNQFLRGRLGRQSHCQLCVIASEDPRPEVVPGMMALADTLIVAEDSLSMISEALSTGKNVVIVKMTKNSLPSKHYRFQEILKTEWGVPVVRVERLSEALGKKEMRLPFERFREERMRIRKKLETLF